MNKQELVNIVKSNFIETCEALLHDGMQSNQNHKWYWDWKIDSTLKRDSSGRVYIIFVDDVIVKIGGSLDKGGIGSTLTGYQTAKSAKPSLRTFGVNQMIEDWLIAGKSVKVYMAIADKIKISVNGIFSSEIMEVSVFKDMEHKCIEDYKEVFGEFPLMNYQEKGEKWPEYINEKHKAHNKNR